MQMEEEGNIPAHIGVALRGKFKARSSIIVEIICYTVAKTHSSLNPGLWVSRLVLLWTPLGPYAQEIHPCLRMRWTFWMTMDLLAWLWRGETTRAMNAGVSQPDIEWTNRLNTSGEQIATGPMHVSYLCRSKTHAECFPSVLGCTLGTTFHC